MKIVLPRCLTGVSGHVNKSFAKRHIRWALCLAAVLASILFYLVPRMQLYFTVKPVLDVAMLNVMSVTMKPVPIAGKRTFDLSYCRGALPASIGGDIAFVGEDGGVMHGDAGIVFLVPTKSEVLYADVISTYRNLSGRNVESPVEFYKIILNQGPIPFWKFIFQSRRTVSSEALLATLKGLGRTDANLKNIRTLENERIAAAVYEGKSMAIIEVFDKKSGYQQAVLVQEKNIEKIDEIVTVLTESLEITSGRSG